MDLDDSYDSDSDYDPDEYDDRDEMDMSDDEVDRSRKTRLSKKSSVVSPPMSDRPSDYSRSPVAAAQAEETGEMYSQPAASPVQPSSASTPGGNNGEFTQPAASPAQLSSAPTVSYNNGQFTLAQQADALRAQAQLRAELQAEDAAWEASGNIFPAASWSFRQDPTTMQPAAQQPSQASTVRQSAFIDFLYNPMVQLAAQQRSQVPTVSQPGLFNLNHNPMMQPAGQQLSQAPTVSRNGFVNFVSDSMSAANDDVSLNEIFDFDAAAGDSEEDADGSEISEGEKARYAALSSFSRM